MPWKLWPRPENPGIGSGRGSTDDMAGYGKCAPAVCRRRSGKRMFVVVRRTGSIAACRPDRHLVRWEAGGSRLQIGHRLLRSQERLDEDAAGWIANAVFCPGVISNRLP